MIFPTAYLAPVSWYKAYLSEPCMTNEIELYESFPKQTLRNLCCIAGPNGVQTLTVPVQKCEHKQLTKDVRVSYQSKWQHQHWQALVSAYRNTPYFDYYEDFFRPLYEKRFEYLIELNEQMHCIICELLGVSFPIRYTTDWHADANRYQQNQSDSTPYYQIFSDTQGFQRDLSIVDLLFNMGQEAPLYL